jgi:hypothetical protein
VKKKPINLFAETLEEILSQHGWSLSLIDDRTPIHREVIRRLKQSLSGSDTYPVLSPDDIERVVEVFGLNEGELLRLRAAALTAKIESFFHNRMDIRDVELAARQIFPLIYQTLWEYQRGGQRQKDGLTNFRGE